jgi:hypothetical protein
MIRSREMLLLAGFLASCYRYSPAPAPSVATGEHVRLALHTPTSPELTRVLGADVAAVEGQVVGASATDLTVAVAATLKPGIANAAPRRMVWAGERVVIPVAAVAGTERRALDRTRTTRLAALAAVAGVVAVRLVVSVAGGGSSGGDGDGGGVPPP